MEFSRLDQFQALWVGIAVADAAAHGYIADVKRFAHPQPGSQPPVASSHWGKALIQVAHYVTTGGEKPQGIEIEQSALAIAILHTPLLLRYLDASTDQYLVALRQLGFSDCGESLSIQLYQLLQVLLRHHPGQPLSMQLAALQPWLDHPPRSEADRLLGRVLSHVLQTGGDFRLAIAGSLPMASSPLLPVLTGLICTALRGIQTIPIPWRQELALPPAAAGYWPQWGLSQELELRGVAMQLWRTWAGL
ncbi:MAG: hypothetical protein O2890_12445 [Cyanobacteria bacterium]|nr:hypothetical protein [Cyanobacteriota bacterium]MDA0867199.1 hypothetical protein [Cyanobacteriota bacterium]